MLKALPPYESIFHPSDFTDASHIAFCHALKLAHASKASLTLQHATSDHHEHWHDFSGIRETLERWNLLPKGSDRHAVAKLGIGVQKVISHGSNPVESVLHYLNRHPADLIVLATHTHEGRMKWLHHSQAEPIARGAHTPTLFIPDNVVGLINYEDGSVNLQNVLIPVSAEPNPMSAVDAAVQLARVLELKRVQFHLLHVGDEKTMPALDLPRQEGWTWNRLIRPGAVNETIHEAASALNADLIVMSTAGHHGFLDALRGSTTERVLHESECPLLAVPPWRY
jgi:nucleotide-binding universal stress UspA family protein